jgi:hypothetical protein
MLTKKVPLRRKPMQTTGLPNGPDVADIRYLNMSGKPKITSFNMKKQDENKQEECDLKTREAMQGEEGKIERL